MADFSNLPKQSNYETTLATPIDSSQTTGITLAVDPDYTPSGETVRVTILNPKGVEHLTCTGWTANVLSGVTRGVAAYSGGPSTARAHGAGVKVIIGNPWQLYDDIKTAINSKIDESGGAAITPMTDATYASLAALQAAYPSPTNGMSAYCTAEGQAYDGAGGAWVARATGTNPNASTTVAGKVEKATSAQSIAGTDTGETGAQTFVGPADIAANIQNNAHVYAASSTGNDTYSITVSPAIVTYVAGQRFIFKTDVGNTGPATLNGIPIKKLHDQDLEDNDIEAGSIVDVIHDGTNFQLQTPLATAITSAQATTLTGGGSADALHTHAALTSASTSGNGTIASPWSATTITHGLGKTPKEIVVKACTTAGVGQVQSDGWWTNSGQGCKKTDATPNTTLSNTDAINITSGANFTRGNIGSVGATTFVITWSTNAGTGVNTQYIWKVR